MVFKTVAENVKSFFQKEEQLSHQPKEVPDAAIEVFERTEKPVQHTIVRHELPQGPGEPPSPPKKLPFSAAELKQRLTKSNPALQRPAPTAREQEPVPEDLSNQIQEFEFAMDAIPRDSAEERPEPARPATDWQGYFDEFAGFLKERGYSLDESALTNELLERMKAHHERRFLAQQHEEETGQAEEALHRKLAELRDLERDWATKQEEIMAARKRAAELEQLIAERTAELKDLVGNMRSLKEQAPPVVQRVAAAPFTLYGGRRISSLGELASALERMDEAIYRHHVHDGKNDFADWILNEFHDGPLASQARAARSQEALARLLRSR